MTLKDLFEKAGARIAKVYEDEDRIELARMDASDLHWDLEQPCNDCPFRKGVPFHKGVCSSLPLYLGEIERGNFAHTCHKTDNRPSCDGPRPENATMQHCAGAIIMLLKTGEGYDLQRPLLKAVDAGKLDLKKMAAIAKGDTKCYTVLELVKFYAKGVAQLAKE